MAPPSHQSRQSRLLPEDLDDDQAALYRAITQGPRSRGPQLFELTDPDGALAGPFGGFLISPGLGDALQGLGAAVRYRTTLPDRVRELAILIVAASWDSTFERDAHEAVGRGCGLAEPQLQAIREQRAPELTDPLELAAVRFVSALVTGDVDDQTWERCVPPLTEKAAYELIVLVGYYSTLALQMRVLRVD